MSDIIMLAVFAAIGCSIGYGLCLARARRRSLAALGLRLSEDEGQAAALRKRLKPERPFTAEWTCQSVGEARNKAWRLVCQANRMIALARKTASAETAMAETYERDARLALRSAAAILDYCDCDVVALIGRMRQAVDGVHELAVELRQVALDRLDALAACGRPRSVEAERLRILANALQAGKPMIATQPVTTLRALNTQLRVIKDVLAAVGGELADHPDLN